MKKLFEEVALEIAFWIAMLYVKIIFGVNFNFLNHEDFKEMKRLSKDAQRASWHAKGNRELYFKEIKERNPDLAEGIDEIEEMRKQIEADPQWQKIVADFTEELNRKK